ncbi:MAG TPA: hypothetical protein PLD02_14420 [Saprospiraceae bacterium]|nr:hypothetical protein [Saprospiraceae bacterium]
MSKVCMYCQVGSALDMAKFSIKSALDNAGMDDYNIIFICWKTSNEVYDWLKENNFEYYDIGYDEGKGFLHNLYRGWNAGYEFGFKKANYVVPIATDHAFYKNWLLNLVKHATPNRIVNCKLIEPGTLPSLHTTRNFGLPIEGEFQMDEFLAFCKEISQDHLVMSRYEYTHRLDAMPFLCSKDVWERFGPMNLGLNAVGTTGDSDWFERCEAGGVEITKALDSISFHGGGLETRRNEKIGVYT